MYRPDSCFRTFFHVNSDFCYFFLDRHAVYCSQFGTQKDNMASLLPEIQFSIGTGILLFGIIQLIYRNSGPLNHCMAAAILSLGYILLYFWSVDTGYISALPLLANTDIPATFLSSAGIYLSFTTILGEKDAPPPLWRRHFILPAFLLAGMAGFNIANLISTGSPAPIEILTRGEPGYRWLHALSFGSDLAYFTYILLTLIQGTKVLLKNEISHRSFFRFMYAFLVGLQLTAVFFLVSRFLDVPKLIEAATFTCGFFVLVFCVVAYRYPEYTQRVLKTISGQNKRKEHLEKRNTDELMTALVNLMEKGKVYKNPVLTLKDVGRHMDIPPQMVSQLVNRKTKKNFRTFINGYRIDAICNLLVKHPDLPILEIAFENGFNSKSAFNTAFQEITGKTPRDYRKGQITP